MGMLVKLFTDWGQMFGYTKYFSNFVLYLLWNYFYTKFLCTRLAWGPLNLWGPRLGVGIRGPFRTPWKVQGLSVFDIMKTLRTVIVILWSGLLV